MRFFKRVILFTASIILLLSLFLLVKYLKWQRDFKDDVSSFICLESIDTENINLEDKIEKFTISDSKSEFIVFSREEIVDILNSNIQNPQSVDISDMCISSKQSMWTIYLKYRISKINMPWIALNIAKDNRESPEIYVKDIRIGNLNLPTFAKKDILVSINKGITDAILLVNENRFLGREIRNIELLEDKVVIKGNL